MADELEYFERLANILRRHGFAWVVAQAQAEIAEGRTITKEVSAPDIQQTFEPDTFVRSPPRKRRAALIASEPFSPAERLKILIVGIEAAILDRAALEKEVLELGDVRYIEFLPDQSEAFPVVDDGVQSHKLGRERLDNGASIRRNLSEALARLRRITDVGA